MSTSTSEVQKGRSVAPPAPTPSSRYIRAHSAFASTASGARKSSPCNLHVTSSPYSTTDRAVPQYAQPIGNGRRVAVQEADQPSSSLPPPVQPGRRTPTMAAGSTTWGGSLRSTSARGHTAPMPLQRSASTACKEKRCKYVVATMKRCGSIYEEMTRQLLATGRWSHVSLGQRPITKALFITETQRDLMDTNVHLLLGEKVPCERVISARREVGRRLQSRLTDKLNGRRSIYGARQCGFSVIRMPMGNDDDGEPRVVDFVENTRSITLKGAMVTNLLKYHHYDWGILGKYLPMSFKLLPRQLSRDDRQELLATAIRGTGLSDGYSEGPRIWIAKSSSGCHGDNIEIFRGDQAGLAKLLRFIDSQRGSHAWIAQQYIDRPLLYHKRKFDIRCWALLLRDTFEIFVHEELVMRTSSVPYDRDTATSKSTNGRLAHITNHCVQETGAAYSLHEEGNELWREHLDGLVRYKSASRHEKARLERSSVGSSPSRQEPPTNDGATATAASSSSGRKDSPYPVREVKRGDAAESPLPPNARGTGETAVTLDSYIMPQISFIVRDTLLAAKAHVPEEAPVPATHTFQVFGYDFLIDDDLKVWLLEINGAPGGPDRLKPALVKDTIELAVAPFFPGTMNLKTKRHNGYIRLYP